MKFFDRKSEIADLEEIRERSQRVAQFTVVTGRRRVGKTSLVVKSLEGEEFVYLFAERRSEKELCEIFAQEINAKLGDVILGEPSRFEQLFEALMKFSQTRHLNLVIDEFQEFRKVNMAIFSSMQKYWDLYKSKAKINLIVTGSVNTLMVKLFRNRKASLYGRETAFMNIEPFRTSVVKEILAAYHPSYRKEDLLALWTLTGGVAKYIELLIDSGSYTLDSMLKTMIRANSFFLDEGKAVSVDEFDKEYGVYFSILAAIARGKTTRNEIEQFVGRQIGGYLARLEDDYALICKCRPLYAKSTSKAAHYQLNDVFLTFWFRFVHRYRYILELKGYERLRSLIKRDYKTFSGGALESYFRNKLAESGKWTRMGRWWDRKGENEIDILLEDELTGKCAVYEVKREGKRADVRLMREKLESFRRATGKWKNVEPKLSVVDIEDM